MLRTLPPTNWSQISKEIPLLLVIMSHREWDSGEDGMGEKGRRFQTSVTILILHLLVLKLNCLLMINMLKFHCKAMTLFYWKSNAVGIQTISSVTLNLGKGEYRPCKVKGSSCSKDTGGRWGSFNVATSSGDRSKIQGFRRSAYSEVRRRLVEIRRRSQEGRLVLEVQGRLAWGKMERDWGVYIRLSWEGWQRKKKAIEGNGRLK